MNGSVSSIGFSANLSHVVKILKNDANPKTLCPQGREVIRGFCRDAEKFGAKAGDAIYLDNASANWNPAIRKTLEQPYGNGRKNLGGFIKFCLSNKRLGTGRLGEHGITNPFSLVLDKKGLNEVDKILIA